MAVEQPRPEPRPTAAGGWLLWFGVLGGAIAWTAHEIAAWSTVELTCASGHRNVAGAPLSLVVAIMVVLPLALAVAALATSWVAWRRLSAAQAEQVQRTGGSERGISRATFMAAVAMGINLLFIAIIAFGGASVAVFPPCQH